MITRGRVHERRGVVYIETTRPPVDNLADEVDVIWKDRRTITPEQNGKAWALIGEICTWAGYRSRDKEDVNTQLKQQFIMQQVEAYKQKMFSLSNCTVTQAREYITFLVDFCLMNDVPTKFPLYEQADDLEAYTYSALMRKKCLICGRHAELHHVDTVGMGYNRKEKPQIGNRVMPLCRTHHMEWHNIGGKAFDAKYHTVPIPLDKRAAKLYGLTRKAREEE